MSSSVIIVTPWYREDLRDLFLSQWGLRGDEPFIHLQHDHAHEGCAVTKNKGIKAAIEKGAEFVIVLDDDCYPIPGQTVEDFMHAHMKALEPVEVDMIRLTTNPPSRGTPYLSRTIRMPVAASMGFWVNVPDYDACSQLVHGPVSRPEFIPGPVYGQYFPLCGMNLAFRPGTWMPWCQFIDVPRFDDIWMGWLWQKEAYRLGYCFNLSGPVISHSRASNVWKNLQEEVKFMEGNELLWRDIHFGTGGYSDLRRLLPV